MATQSGGGGLGEALGSALALIIYVVFSLTFPILFLTLCGASYVLAYLFHLPEFVLWAALASLAIAYAKTNIWVALGLGAFALAALPLAWVAFREQEVKASNTILMYVVSGIVIGFMFWLRTVWPYDGNGWQLIAYGIIMFMAWSAIVEAALGTIGIVAHVRRNRPQPVRPPPQQPHGAPREERRSRSEPETI
jgi:hypothetical protein